VFGGPGPNVLGVGGFSPAQRISSSVGCRDRNSAVSFGDGILFKSNSGWQLLDRSMNVTPVGLPVQAYDAHEVYRAALCPKKRQIRVVHKPTDSTTVLVFDYLRSKWDTISYAATVTPVDTCEIDGTVHVLGSAGVVYTEDDTTNINDNGTAFTPKVVSPWLSNEMSDFQRIWWVKLVGEWPASGNLTVKFYYDYSGTAAETVTVDVSTIETDGVFRLKPDRAQCKAFRVELSGAIYRISKVSLEVGQRPGRVGRVTSTA